MRILSIILVLFFFGCKKTQPKTGEQISNSKSIENKIKKAKPKEMEIPEGFSIDTISFSDESKRLETEIILPISGIREFDNSVKNEILCRRSSFINELTKRIKDDNGGVSVIGSSFTAELVSIFRSKNLISYCFRISDYVGGNVHPMDIYYSMNYNFKTNKHISFNDYFNIRTKKDTLFLTQTITKTINEETILVENLKNLDFNIERDSISFNYDDYEIASYAFGLIRAKISKQELKSKINDNYW
ncbi:DUF3298 domain-containing protein [Flavobacterium sp. MAH-1]|uniref:DUF3298 domain-containing protein n=1 Tax=Flavobacterium agri TaxID=2743471 RepID=A0A7Y8Y4H0_9FLAO|nr:DUF3298 domain-containing protein [Flavobacterium agri]NYA72372.1 DUF3298 domain-containing protein [Flavobacterium agri]